jgi:hypothetical protein
MPTLIAQAKLRQATRLTVVDKKISAVLTSAITITCIGEKVKRTIIDLDCVSSISLTPEKLFRIGFTNTAQPGYFQRGQRYTITDLGTADYNLIADTTSVTYQVGSVFTAANSGEKIPPVTGRAMLLNNQINSTLTCKFPTYIRIDLEALGMDSYEGQDCIMQLDEGVVIQGNYPGSEFTPNPPEASFMTFRIPKYFRSQLSSSVSSSNLVLRIKQLASSLNSAVSLSAFAQLNPGKFAALVFSLGSINAVARKTAIGASALSSIVNIIINNTTARLFNISLSSQFTMPPIDFWYRRLGASAMTSTATMNSTAIKNVSISLSLSQVSTMTTLAVKNVNVVVPMVANNSVSAQVNYRVDSLMPTMSSISSLELVTDIRFIMQTDLNAFDYLGNPLTNNTTVNVPIYNYTYAGINIIIDWGDGTTTTYTAATTGTGTLPIGGTNHTYAQHGEYDIRIKVSGGTLGGMVNMELAGTAYPNTNWTNKIKRFMSFGHRNFTVSGSDLIFQRLFARVPYQQLSVPNELPLAGNSTADWRLESMFENTLANPPEISNWTFRSRALWLQSMFSGATNFNQPFTNWSLANVTTPYYGGFVAGAGSFNQPITFWKFPDATYSSGGQFTMSLNGTNMNSENWNRTLIAMANALVLNTRTTAPNRFIGTVTRPSGATTNSTVYGSGSYNTGTNARNYLITRGWTVG